MNTTDIIRTRSGRGILPAAAGLALLALAPAAAFAHTNVSLGINLGGYYPPAYAPAPTVVYTPPPQVYYAPAPEVYYEAPRRVYYAPYSVHYEHFDHRREWRGHERHEWRDHDRR